MMIKPVVFRSPLRYAPKLLIFWSKLLKREANTGRHLFLPTHRACIKLTGESVLNTCSLHACLSDR